MNIQIENGQKARSYAEECAPGELWSEVSPGVFVAASRIPKSDEQVRTYEKELVQARLLAASGHAVYLLPENGPRGVKHPVAVVDGMIMEFKTVTGNIRKAAVNYKAAREKAENVFLKIDAPLTRHAVTRRLSGVIRDKGYTYGVIWTYFTATGEMNYWSVDDLR